MFGRKEESTNDGQNVIHPDLTDIGSSNQEWLPDFRDTVESSYDDFKRDCLKEPQHVDPASMIGLCAQKHSPR